MQQIISNIGSFLWGPPMIVAIMGCGILLTVRSKFFVFRYFGLIFRKALGSMKSSGQKRTGNASPLRPSAWPWAVPWMWAPWAACTPR